MTLSGGALAISLTFIKDIVAAPRPGTLVLLGFAWIFLSASITAILISILTGAFAIGRAIKQVDDGTIYDQTPGGPLTRITSTLNISACVAFVVGVLLLAAFAIWNMSGVPHPTT